MCAGTGAALHLAGPLGFNFEEKHVRRAGLDYHDLADVHLHEDFEAAAVHLTGLSRQQADPDAAGPSQHEPFERGGGGGLRGVAAAGLPRRAVTRVPAARPEVGESGRTPVG